MISYVIYSSIRIPIFNQPTNHIGMKSHVYLLFFSFLIKLRNDLHVPHEILSDPWKFMFTMARMGSENAACTAWNHVMGFGAPLRLEACETLAGFESSHAALKKMSPQIRGMDLDELVETEKMMENMDLNLLIKMQELLGNWRNVW